MTRQFNYIRRTTAVGDALISAFADRGIDLPKMAADAGHRLPTKREPNWRVTRREKKGRK
jgi:hypothetical protein